MRLTAIKGPVIQLALQGGDDGVDLGNKFPESCVVTQHSDLEWKLNASGDSKASNVGEDKNMSSKEKKSWTRPTHLKFESAHDAIAYYSERGMFEHVAAIKKMSAQRE